LLYALASHPTLGQEADPDLRTNSGKVAGTITYQGRIPKAPQPDASGTYRELFTRDPTTQGVQQVVVYLAPAADARPLTSSPDDARSTDTPSSAEPAAMINQRDFLFEPHLILLRDGETIDFTNSDSGNHHLRTRSSDARNEFAVYTGPGGNYQHRFFAETSRTPVYLGCDIHLWMGAWIFVFDDEPATLTDAQGHFELTDLSPGRYVLHVRQPDVGLTAERDVTVEADTTTRCDVRFVSADLRAIDQD
jgi:plastocyanin